MAAPLPPLCRDCRHAQPTWPRALHWWLRLFRVDPWGPFTDCGHPKTETREPASLVSGRTNPPQFESANIARLKGEPCGPDGLLFEARR